MTIKKFLYLRESLKNSKASHEKLKSMQEKKLADIMRYSYKNVPYYKRLWSKIGINISGIRTIKDIKKLPVINKQTVLKNYGGFISNEYKKYLGALQWMPSFLFMRSTSGTSGTPMKIYFNPDAKDRMDAVYARALLKVGYNTFKPMAYYWWQLPTHEDFYNFLGMFKKVYVPSIWNEQEQLAFMQKTKPEYFYYYPSALYFISRLVLHENVELNFRPKLVFTHAEILTESMRKTIENAFDASVYDQYATNEFGVVSWECEEKCGYHVNSDSVLVEIVDENYDDVGEGETGRVLITGLLNNAMPLIRYEIGDFAVKAEDSHEKNNCSVNLPSLIKSIEGRYEHSNIGIDGKYTQKSLLDKIMKVLDGEKELFKLQSFVNTKTKKITVNYTNFSNNAEFIKNHGKTTLGKYTLLFKGVNNVIKNQWTGKTLLLEKSI